MILLFGLPNQRIHGQRLPEFIVNNRYNRQGEFDFIQSHLKFVSLKGGSTQLNLNGTRQYFEFITGQNEVHTWGRGNELPGVYFREDLPAFFFRHLECSDFKFEDGLFEWVFTGDNAAFNITISKDSIWIFQRYYDSFGYNHQLGNKLFANRHPENVWLLHRVGYEGTIRNISISMNHKMYLKVFLNGIKVSEQSCFFDVTEHQLRFSGKDVSIKGELMTLANKDVVIELNWDVKEQTMIGWGGIATPTAYDILSDRGKKMWWALLMEYNLLLHREYPNGQNLNADLGNWDKLEDAMPHYYGDNFPNSEISNFEYIKKIQDLGGITIFEFWKFPLWVQEDNKSPDIDAYCKAMVGYCKKVMSETGLPPAIVGIQNEKIQSDEDWHAMTLALRKELDRNGLTSVKIHHQDAGRLVNGLSTVRSFSSVDKVWNTIDYSAAHMYDYQNHFQDPDRYDSLMIEYKALIGDKPFLSTELCVNRNTGQTGSYRVAFSMAQLYHKNLTILNASSIMYCWILLNTVQPSYEASRSLFGIDKSNGFVPYPSSYQLRTYGAWSRRIKKDMYRIEASASDPDLLVTAFDGKAGQTIVLVNRSKSVRTCSMNVSNDIKWIEKTSPYFQNHIETADASKGKELQIRILPGEIITLSNVALNQ